MHNLTSVDVVGEFSHVRLSIVDVESCFELKITRGCS